jgi:hypothetical protein
MTASPVIYGLFRALRWSPNNEFRATGLLKILSDPATPYLACAERVILPHFAAQLRAG